MGFLFWGLGSFFYFYQFFFRTIFSTIGDEIAVSFQISHADLAPFLGISGIAYALVQIPGGMLLDCFGTRKVLAIAMGTLATGVLLVSKTHHYELAILGRILMGLGSAFGFLGASKIVLMWFPLHYMPLLLGITVFLGGFGGAFSNFVYEHTPEAWDWRQTLLVFGSIGVAFSLFIALIMRDREGSVVEKRESSLLQEFKFMITNRNILLAGFFTFFAYIPISVFADSWGPLAFEKIFNASKEEANQTIAYFYVAYSLGSIFYSVVASTLKQRTKEVLIFEWVFLSVCLYLLLFQVELGQMKIGDTPGFLLLSSIIGFNLGGVALAFPIACSHSSSANAGAVVGFVNFLCMISGGLYTGLMGKILHLHWEGEVNEAGIEIFSGNAFQHALQPIFFMTLLALVLILFAQEKNSHLAYWPKNASRE